MRARFITDTATVDVNPVEVKGSINVEPNIIKGNVSVSSASGTNKHDKLINRDLSDQHPIGAITGLQEALDDKQGVLTAGEGISIENGVISNTQTSAEWGNIQGDVNDQVDLKNELDGKQDTISDLSTIRTNAEHGESAYNAVNEYGDIVTHNVNEFATSTQGALADTALQTGDNVSSLVNDSGYITGINSADVTTALGYIPYDSNNPDNYTSNIGTVTSVNNVSPDNNGNVSITLPDPQIQSDWNQSDDTALDYIKNKPTIPSGVIVDQVYDDTSTNPQSGVAIAGAGFITSSSLPTVNNATLTIQKNGTTVDTFTANASVDKTINLVVPTTAADVGALSNSTKYATGLSLTINSTTFVVTGQLKDQDGNNLGSAQTIDLPLESVVVNGSYDSENKKVILTLENGSTIEFSVADLVAGLQSEITSSNKLNADLVDDNNAINKFVTTSEKSLISSALQPNDNVSNLTNDAGYINGIDSSDVTTALGYTPVNPSDLASVATSGSYNDLSNKPSIPTATSDLTNDSGYLTSADLSTIESDIEDLQDANKVINVVNTYAELQSYNTLTVTKNSIIKVIADETNNGKTSWYQWSSQGAGTAFVQPTLTADGTLGGADFACACDSTYNRRGNPDYAWHAFDGRTNVSTAYPSSFWNSGSGQPHWIEFYNPEPLTVTNIKIYNGESGSVAKDWQFQCSDDGSTWTTLTSGTNTTTGQGANWNFNVTDSGNHKYYRFYTTTSQGQYSVHLTIAEIVITGIVGAGYGWSKIKDEGKYATESWVNSNLDTKQDKLTSANAGTDISIVSEILPSAYKRVTGFTMNNDCYFQITGFYLKGSDTLRFSFTQTTNSVNVLGCFTSSSDTDNYSLYAGTNSNAKYLRYNGGTYSSTIALNKKYDVVITPTGATGLEQSSSWTAQSFTSAADFCIGTSSPSVSSSKFIGTLHGEIVVDGRARFIPCERLSDNVLGYYEYESGTFYTPTVGTPVSTGYDNIPALTISFANDSGYITGITSGDVTTALGYTPYNSSNPNGYTSNVGTVTSVNNVSPDSNGNVSLSIPTATSDLSNDSGFITGISSSDVTTALGYTPVNPTSLATVATSGSYTDLSNKPTIPTVNNATLTIQKNGTTVKTFTANASSNVTANISVPTKVSDLSNDSGFITGISSSDVTNALGYTPANDSNVVKTSGSQDIAGTKKFTDTIRVGGTTYGSYGRDNIELRPLTTATHGGYIDFHYAGDTSDYTSRIVENSSGNLRLDCTSATAPTPATSDNSSKIATTAYVKSNLTDYVAKSSVYYDSTTSTLYIG